MAAATGDVAVMSIIKRKNVMDLDRQHTQLRGGGGPSDLEVKYFKAASVPVCQGCGHLAGRVLLLRLIAPPS